MYISKRTRQPADQVHYESLFDEHYLPLPFSMATTEMCPIIRWQANVMQDGIVLAVSFHHSVFDAAGIHTIQHALAKLCREPSTSMESLSLRSDLLIGRKRMHHCAIGEKCGRSKNAKQKSNLKTANFNSAECLVSRRFCLDAHKIHKLRTACTELMHVPSTSSNSEVGLPVTSNDVISAFFWMVITKCRYGSTIHTEGLEDDLPVESSLVLMTEVRRILSPPLPTSYVGNASVQTITTSPTQTFLHSTHRESSDQPLRSTVNGEVDISLLTRLAIKVYASRTSVDNAHVKEVIEQKLGDSNWSPNFKQGDIVSTSLRRMDVYNLDFGPLLGRVFEFENPENRIDGTMCILPARLDSKYAPWEIRMTLEPGVMAQLEEDRSFRWAAGYYDAKL
ncbi:transferase family-domain-containing protein [Penicillium sp. IBT 31633x]|nr:transferase family-domain-containing protein [Penicillium sp. IBT 31633x]